VSRWLPRCQVRLGLLICAVGSANAQKPPAISESFLDVQGEGVTVRGFLAKPSTGSDLPAMLLVFQESESSLQNPVARSVRDMAEQGFVALAVNYDPDHVKQQSDLLQSIGEEQLSVRLAAAVEWLALQRPLVDPQRVSAIGFDEASARVLKLAQQGHIHAGVMVESERCAAPENLPVTPGAPMLLVINGCTQERGREVKASVEAGGVYRVALAPPWTEMFKFLKETQAPPPSSVSSNLVVTIRDIMRVINSDDGVRGKLARVLAASASPGAEVQWDLARSHAAVLVESNDWLIGLRPPKGSSTSWHGHVADYRGATETLLKAVEQHDLPGAQQALGRLPQSCGSCHADHR
jgi:dienelactone hydrolase